MSIMILWLSNGTFPGMVKYMKKGVLKYERKAEPDG